MATNGICWMSWNLILLTDGGDTEKFLMRQLAVRPSLVKNERRGIGSWKLQSSGDLAVSTFAKSKVCLACESILRLLVVVISMRIEDQGRLQSKPGTVEHLFVTT